MLIYNRLLSSMEIKLKRQELLTTLQRLKVVEGLKEDVLQEFSKLFKVKDQGNTKEALTEAFKNRIADIFIQEGEAYEDYLQLPKFRSMTAERQIILSNLFKKVWDECQENRHREHLFMARQEAQQLTTVFKNSEQAQKFHLSLLQMFRQSPLCPKIKTMNIKVDEDHQMPVQNSYHQSNLDPSRSINLQNKEPSQQFPPQTKIQAPQEGTPYIQPLFEVPRYPMPPPPPQSYMVPQFYRNHPPQNIPFQGHHNTIPFPNNPIPMPNNFCEKNWTFLLHSFQTYEFIQCVCQGRYGKQSDHSFKCASCGYSYHYNCMRIEKTDKEEILCPICNLRKESIFCTVVREPLKCIWHIKERNTNEFRLEMSEEENQQIIQSKRNGLDCQVRFLRIDGKSLGKRNNHDYITEGGILHKQVKYSEITLPEISDSPQPLALDIMLKSEEQQNYSPKLYFFAVFLVSIRTIKQIVEEVFESQEFFPQSYYNQFFEGQQQVIQIKFNNDSTDSQGLMKYPVRGINCLHARVFDLVKYLNIIISLRKDRESQPKCPICSKECPSFKYDAFLYNKIKQNQDYQKQKPEGIEIKKNGEIKWLSMEKFFIVEEDGNAGVEHQQQKNVQQQHDSNFLEAEQDEMDEEE